MNPDVLAVQEVGAREALDRVGGQWHIELAETDTDFLDAGGDDVRLVVLGDFIDTVGAQTTRV